MTVKNIILGLITLLSTSLGYSEQQANENTINNSAVILLYHHVADDTPAITSVSPQQFEQQLDYLQANDFKVWPLPQLMTHYRQGLSIPDKVVAITFDDAYESVYSQAYPRLKQRGMPFTIFVTTDSVDKQFNKQLNWQALLEMSRNGATIANHTVNHPHMLYRFEGENDKQWQQRMQQEIDGAQQRIAEQIGSQHKLFAYPYGEHNQSLKEQLAQMGYLAFGQQSGALGPYSHAQSIPRYPIAGDYSKLDDFILKIHTKAMPAIELSSSATPLSAKQSKPTVTLEFKQAIHKPFFQCYGPGGKLPLQWQANTVTITAAVDIPAGRSRYNCTLPAGDNRYYWYSKPWVRLKDDGTWILD
ncbi:polysaccharide deacetylase family protein [Dasania sp. GY-MA-18]|uniref:Polysaccharide deacetylase family protein n=1 Tax=Dasania phycosphaerae TaxID=2950436 RepID=A0A9J6RQT8_9GAMM|nr:MULTISPECIES: polysaccharide deacetylase family protein [Dasania]MCR8924191.1 polysaccharide deacetylase family protein [Dasania sp. GY-MA-18]MCZ0866844.1 polysaccharide deacetylase family protein [Dasania phycosphaerae]MCZ0870349.1 polysaccharide deacetylase family protein [Dasania phycosphaerae]